jgi:VanZ family protein
MVKALMISLFRFESILLVVALFTVGSVPATGHAFPGNLHWAVHLATYALISFSVGMGWQKSPAAFTAVVVAAIGIIHEVTEIVTHNHHFEFYDAVVNTLGAVIGMVFLILVRKWVLDPKSGGMEAGR